MLLLIFLVNSIEIEKVNLMYNETKVKIDEELGYVCICLDGGYGNKMRKKFIEEGLNCGFKNVEIINYETAFYLNAMSRIDYKPSNGDIIWIEALCYFYVWKITNVKAEFIGKWKADSTNLADLQNIVIESKLKKGPDVLLAQYKMKEKVFNGISICQFFSYTHYRYSYLLGTLIKAQITAGNLDLAPIDAQPFLSHYIILRIRESPIITFKLGEKLPIIYAEKIRNINDCNLEIVS